MDELHDMPKDYFSTFCGCQYCGCCSIHSLCCITFTKCHEIAANNEYYLLNFPQNFCNLPTSSSHKLYLIHQTHQHLSSYFFLPFLSVVCGSVLIILLLTTIEIVIDSTVPTVYCMSRTNVPCPSS